MIGRDQMLNGSDLGETVQSRGTEGSAPALGPACTDVTHLGGIKADWIGLSRSSGSRSSEDSQLILMCSQGRDPPDLRGSGSRTPGLELVLHELDMQLTSCTSLGH